MDKIRKSPAIMGLCIFVLFVTTVASKEDRVTPTSLIHKIEHHAENKQRVLTLLSITPKLELTKRFGCDFRDTWRRIIIDGIYDGIEKVQFLEIALRGYADSQQSLEGHLTVELPKALRSLLESHRSLFGSGQNSEFMIRHAGDPALKSFSAHMSLAQAVTAVCAGNDEQIQSFKTNFETGQNTRGYVHKLECHAEALEFIYAVTDIVYGVMFPAELHFNPNHVIAEPVKVSMFYVKAGDVITLHPYVLHSGSLSVEPDKSFSIIIYKKPVQAGDIIVRLPDARADWQERLKLPDIDKYYLTLEQMHTAELKDNLGFIAARRPMRLPAWP